MKYLVVGTESENPFAIDIACHFGQKEDPADVIFLKTYANGEFCPQFTPEQRDRVGYNLEGHGVVIVTTGSPHMSRDALMTRTLLVARAARDNGAETVILIEPDLFFSAQDRGPRADQGDPQLERDEADYKKFDGQAFSSRFYAEMLALAGVDSVLTVHNHSNSVGRVFRASLKGHYLNLSPAPVFADYALQSDLIDTSTKGSKLLICAPDRGARGFAQEIASSLDLAELGQIFYAKDRQGERSVAMKIADDSPTKLAEISGRDVLIVDDMVRTGSTIAECCRQLRAYKPRRIVFAVTHFYSSEECRACLHNEYIDEIVTTNTIPMILNRDHQGRLRRKLTVLKLEPWIAQALREVCGLECLERTRPSYRIDMSSKNLRYQGS